MKRERHYHQKVIFKTGYLEATRDDTAKLQDFRLSAYRTDGTLVKRAQYLYNIQYDYIRIQEWVRGILVEDSIYLESECNGYGHLQEEFYGSNWDNPYPDDFEPVTPQGTAIFRKQGFVHMFFCVELNVMVLADFYVWSCLEKRRKKLIDYNSIRRERHAQRLNLLTFLSSCDSIFSEEPAANTFSPVLARIKRLKQIDRNSRLLRCEYMHFSYKQRIHKKYPKLVNFVVPVDSRFVD